MKLDTLAPGQKYKPYPHRLPSGCQIVGTPDAPGGDATATAAAPVAAPEVAIPEPPVLDPGMGLAETKKVVSWLKTVPATVLKEALKVLGF